jgi:hypothetical protein
LNQVVYPVTVCLLHDYEHNTVQDSALLWKVMTINFIHKSWSTGQDLSLLSILKY